MKHALRATAKNADVLHTNSLWMLPNVYPGRAVRGTGSSLVVSPRGTLSPWALGRARLRKWLVWTLGQRQTLQRADCIHVTSQEEMEHVRHLGLTNPVALIPNGVRCPDEPPERTSDAKLFRTLLFLARIHPTKGLDTLLTAWRILEPHFPDWQLQIVGPLDSSYAKAVQSTAVAFGLTRVVFTDELVGEDKVRAYQAADLYVLPSHSENFGISVAEALAHGVPAIVFHGAPWSGLNRHQAGWWIEPSVASLAETLRRAMSEPEALRRQRGLAGYQWMKREFDWDSIAQRMSDLYTWLRTDGPPPATVYLS